MAARTRTATTRGELITVAVGVLLVVASWIPASTGNVSSWEATVFRHVNDLPDAFWAFLRVPMQLGSLAGSFAVVAATFLITATAGSRSRPSSGVKPRTGRPRPSRRSSGAVVPPSCCTAFISTRR